MALAQVSDPSKGSGGRLFIELSTVAFFRGEAPREIALRSCSIPMSRASSCEFSALYGLQGKQEGFVAARDFAISQGLKYTVIDIVVGLEAQNPKQMKVGELPAYDFLNLARATRGLSDSIAEWLVEANGGRMAPEVLADLSSEPLRQCVARRPDLISEIFSLGECEHLKVIAHQGLTRLSAEPLGLATISPRFWSSIREATCRLNPTIRITL